ncbi:MAG: L-rhamnose mutarotase [Saprospirales bacterium]|nr:L-rhamnose mutarotase [Saprospirales bacterium]MBK8492896.1 L-rhamnose mutarotase [Saprospirales bacterium]
MTRYGFALDLINDAESIKAYEEYHKNVWPEIMASIRSAGIEHMEIYRLQDRLFMLIDVNDAFSFEKKATLDENNPKVQEWEQLMGRYQKTIPGGKRGEKWRLMENIFTLG